MKKELSEYGLSEKEIKIYLAMIKTGSCTSNRLSELTNIRRATIYDLIESLKKKGLVSSARKDKKLFFSASPPEIMIENLKEKKDMIEGILPQINELSKTIPEKPKVELFEGITAVKNSVMETLDYKEILCYGASQKGEEILDSFTENFARKRVKNKVMLKAVVEKNFPKYMAEDREIKKYTQIRTTNSFKNHNSVYFIYGSRLLIITLGSELIATRITSPLLAESQKKIFEILWNGAK